MSGWTLSLKMQKHGKKINKLEKERLAKQTKKICPAYAQCRSKFQNSFFFTYVDLLEMWDQRLFTESLSVA